jgi:CubicO group peptidase (beta-lactamase class C family)
MTLRDYGRVGQFMLDHGKAAGQDVVPAGWTEDATSQHVANPPYGYFWRIIPGGYEAAKEPVCREGASRCAARRAACRRIGAKRGAAAAMTQSPCVPRRVPYPSGC